MSPNHQLLGPFLRAENASVRLCNIFSNLGQATLGEFVAQWPLLRLKNEIFGFGPKAQAELLEILERQVSRRTGRPLFTGYCESLRPVDLYATDERTCVHCGCTDSRACPGGCAWVVKHKFTATGICSNEACLAKVLKEATGVFKLTIRITTKP